MKSILSKCISCTFIILITITATVTVFAKPIFAEPNACSTEIVTNPQTGKTYCMPQSIYDGSPAHQAQYRTFVRTGNVSQYDIDLLEQMANSWSNMKQWWNTDDDKTIGEFFDVYGNRLGSIFDSWRKGYFHEYANSMIDYFLGYINADGFTPVNRFKKELDSVQMSPNRNYYSTGSNNTYYSGDTNYSSFYDYNTNNFYYQNNYYEVNNYTYNYINNYTTYNISNSFYFNVTYNVDNTVVNIVNNGVSNTSTYYFRLPDGRNSYNLTQDQINGLKTDLYVSNYDEFSNDDDLVALFHFDGNKKNSAYYNSESNRSNTRSTRLVTSYFIPSEYRELQYIESDGTQYINTNVLGRRPIDYEVKFSPISIPSTNFYVIGYPAGNNQRLSPFYILASGRWYMGYGASSINTGINGLVAGTDYTVSGHLANGSQTINVNGNTYSNTISDSFTQSNDYYYLFCQQNANGAANMVPIKLYYLDLYTSNELRRSYKPVIRISDGKVGLYDVSKKSFYGSATSSNFIAGPYKYNTQYTVTVASNPSAGGSVSGGGTYYSHQGVTIKATPARGYRFLSWSDGSTQNPRQFSVSSNVTYTANFTYVGTGGNEGDNLFSMSPNSITYLSDNSAFGNFLYIGAGDNDIDIDLTDQGNEIDFRFYPTIGHEFSLSFNQEVDFNVETQTSTIINRINTSSQNVIVYQWTDTYNHASNVSCPFGYTNEGESTVSTGSGVYSHLKTCKGNVTGYQNVPSSVNTLYFDENSELLRFGEWNHIAIQRNGDMWINGAYFGNFDVFGSSDVLHIDLNTDSYCYLDEIRISKSYKYNNYNIVGGLSFTPGSVPYDTNVVYILPQDASGGTLLIQSTIEVNKWQIGGVRPSNPVAGDVYCSVTDYGLLDSLQQYDGSDWISVKGAIYNPILDLWVSYYGYSIYTNNWSYNDLSEMNVNDIESKADFFGWLGAWFTKLHTALKDLAINVTNTINNSYSEDNSSANEVTNNITENYNIDVDTDIQNNIDNLIDADQDIDLTLPENNLTSNQVEDLQKLSPLITGVYDIFVDNGIGWWWLLILVIAILGVVL